MSASRRTLILSALVLLTFAMHLPFIATTLEDLDSINFAFGLRDFDPREHRPHPPGYPVIIGLGKAVRAGLIATGAHDGAALDARALALVSALTGALTILPLFFLARTLDLLVPRTTDRLSTDTRALLATTLVVCAPLFWFSMSRPMSDVPGVLLALCAQACLVAAWVEGRVRTEAAWRCADRLLLAGAAFAALAVGARSQAVWLVAPILTLALIARRGPGATRARTQAGLAFVVASLAWGLPLLAQSGGLDGYLHPLASQAGEDFAGVEMFWTTRSLRVLAFALHYTLIEVWGPFTVGALVCAAAIVGLGFTAIRASVAALIVSVLWLPYFVFHLLFQETVTSRYALPLVIPAGWLAVQALSLIPRSIGVAAVAAAATAGLVVTTPALSRYARDGSPVSRALDDMRRQADATGRPTVVVHHTFARAVEADGRFGKPLTDKSGRESFEIVRRWEESGPGPVWFLAEPRRTDLAVVDPTSRRERGRFTWTFNASRFIRGTRPGSVVWHELSGRPGWYLGEGWALTPELAGIARRDRLGLAAGPLVGWVRRRSEPAVLMLGGRHLGSAADRPVRLELSLDGRVIDASTAAAGPFLRLVSIPGGQLAGEGYAQLRVTARADGPIPPLAVEQFDLQSHGVPVSAFDAGWHEQEYDRRTGRLFRWSSRSATLRVADATDDIELIATGESPLKYFDVAPTVVIRAGATEIARYTPDRAFDWRIRVPIAVLSAAQGRISIDTDKIFTPAELGTSGDRRELGLRFYEMRVVR